MILARCGDTYFSFRYQSDVLQNEHWGGVTEGQGGLCVGLWGMLYVAGDFSAAHSAQAVVQVTNGSEARDFTLTGERLGEEVFGFRFSDRESRIFLDDKSVEEMDLSELVQYWYRTPSPDGSGHSYDHADVPVTVTLYSEAGTVLDTLALTADTYEFHVWY